MSQTAMTKPKFNIGEVVLVPDAIGHPCYQIQARLWDESFAEWIYFGPHSHGNHFVNNESRFARSTGDLNI
jgi:hypothetical protein